MEVNNNKLFDLVKKKIGMQKPIFSSIIGSDDLFEWSVEACLYASQKHDEMVIREA